MIEAETKPMEKEAEDKEVKKCRNVAVILLLSKETVSSKNEHCL